MTASAIGRCARASRLVSSTISRSGYSSSSSSRSEIGSGSIAVTRAPLGAAQRSSSWVSLPLSAPTSITDLAPAASKQAAQTS